MIAKRYDHVKRDFINGKINYQQPNMESLQLVTKKQWFARIFFRNYRNVNDSTISLASRDGHARMRLDTRFYCFSRCR